jgi:DNA-binding protein H-NS
MFYKLAILVLCATVTGMALLMLRHHRYETMYEMAKLQKQITITRQQLWEEQTRIARQIDPAHLTESLASAEIPLRSVMPVPTPLIQPTRTASKQTDIPVP